MESPGNFNQRDVYTGGTHAGRDVAGVIEQAVVGADDNQRGGKPENEP